MLSQNEKVLERKSSKSLTIHCPGPPLKHNHFPLIFWTGLLSLNRRLIFLQYSVVRGLALLPVQAWRRINSCFVVRHRLWVFVKGTSLQPIILTTYSLILLPRLADDTVAAPSADLESPQT